MRGVRANEKDTNLTSLTGRLAAAPVGWPAEGADRGVSQAMSDTGHDHVLDTRVARPLVFGLVTDERPAVRLGSIRLAERRSPSGLRRPDRSPAAVDCEQAQQTDFCRRRFCPTMPMRAPSLTPSVTPSNTTQLG